MPELKVHVPTYYGNLSDKVEREIRSDFGDPYVPLLVRRSDGLRVVIGSHDYFDMGAPDIQVERRPQGWAILLHPVGGGDPSGYVYFLDDGRSLVIPERSDRPIRVVESTDEFPELDMLCKTGRRAE